MSKSGPLNYGNINMKGKKAVKLSCQCCDCLDLRDKLNERVISREIDLELNPLTAAELNDEAHWMEHEMHHYEYEQLLIYQKYSEE